MYVFIYLLVATVLSIYSSTSLTGRDIIIFMVVVSLDDVG